MVSKEDDEINEIDMSLDTQITPILKPASPSPVPSWPCVPSFVDALGGADPSEGQTLHQISAVCNPYFSRTMLPGHLTHVRVTDTISVWQHAREIP